MREKQRIRSKKYFARHHAIRCCTEMTEKVSLMRLRTCQSGEESDSMVGVILHRSVLPGYATHLEKGTMAVAASQNQFPIR